MTRLLAVLTFPVRMALHRQPPELQAAALHYHDTRALAREAA